MVEQARKMTMKKMEAKKRKVEEEVVAMSAGTPPPTTPPNVSPTPSTSATPVESSAKKRKRLFAGADQGETVVQKDDYNIIIKKSELEKLASKVLCSECYASPKCSFETYGCGTDSKGTISCDCDEELCSLNWELVGFRKGRLKYYSTTMKFVYNSLLEGLSHEAVAKSCALLDMNIINKRQWLKYKRVICAVAVAKTQKHLNEGVEKIFKYYSETLDRHPDEDGILDIDVSFDGMVHYLFVFVCILLYFVFIL